MRRAWALAGPGLACLAAAACHPASAGGGAANPAAYGLDRTEQVALEAAEGRPYRISIAAPAETAPADGYPVIYVLDPSSSFATLVETARNREPFLGPAVVVGIGYPESASGGERMRDLTPPTDRATLPPDNLGTPWGEMGEADAFLRFVEERVKPAVEARLPIDRGRQALFGHSFGGLFVLHTLFNRPEAFQTYVAASPSIWWGGRSILGEARAFRQRPPRAGPMPRLLITVGGYEDEVRPQEEVALAKTVEPADFDDMKRRYRAYVADIAPIGNCEALFALLTEPPAGGLEVEYVVFPEETHNSVIPAYLGRGVSFALLPEP